MSYVVRTVSGCTESPSIPAPSAGDQVSLSDGFWRHGWERAGVYFAELRRERADALSSKVLPEPLTVRARCGREDLPALLNRQCVRFFRDTPLSKADAIALADEARNLQADYPWVRVFAIAQAVEGFTTNAVVEVGAEGWVSHGPPAASESIDRLARGMWWVNGGGLIILLCADMGRLYDGRGLERTYLDMLLTLGVVCQSMVRTMTTLGLGGWMTPAIEEATAHKLLACGQTIEPLYMLKLGVPVPFDELVNPSQVRDHAIRMGARADD